MKNLFCILLFCSFATICLCQVNNRVIDGDGRLVSHSVSSLNSKIPLFLQIDKNTKSISPWNAIPNDSLGNIVFLEGATTVSMTTRLKKDSLKYYRYSIIEDDITVLVSDALLSKIDFIWPKRSDNPGFLTMNFGISNIVNKKLTIKIYRLSEERDVTTLIIYNKPVSPAKILKLDLISQAHPNYSENYLIGVKNGAEFRTTEMTRGLYLSIQNSDLNFIYQIFLDYEGTIIQLPNKINMFSSKGDPVYFIDLNYFNKPGKYMLMIGVSSSLPFETTNRYEFSKISFKVLSVPTPWTKYLLITGLAISLIAALIIFLIRRNSKRKIIAADRQTEESKLELTNIRSQLNPHFVFNALGGIQNLMNKNEVEMANNYLDRFARLTRNILNDHALISIKDEILLLEDYLSMEQLRFSFHYEIHTDDSLNFTNTEIPAMLIQPFAENAVKHSMAELKEEGKLVIRFIKEGDNVILTVTDNGKGFDVSRNYKGLGLKLSKKRIALLNQMYKECPVTLEIKPGDENTQVKIILTHWL